MMKKLKKRGRCFVSLNCRGKWVIFASSMINGKLIYIRLLIVNWLFTLSEHQLSKPKCCSFHFFNAGHTLEDLWTKLSNEFHQGLFDKCNITFQVSICIC